MYVLAPRPPRVWRQSWHYEGATRWDPLFIDSTSPALTHSSPTLTSRLLGGDTFRRPCDLTTWIAVLALRQEQLRVQSGPNVKCKVLLQREVAWIHPAVLYAFQQVLETRSSAGSKRSVRSQTQQSSYTVLLEVVLAHWNIHLYRGKVQPHTGSTHLYWAKQRLHTSVSRPVFLPGGHQSHSAVATGEANRVLWG